ncbi:lysine--tRNA ligase [Candidatus Micrarchaeota archaeon]|nr:lysine--tRNA ligase [Candidatus Micrarchaeota archaeon]
MKMSEKKHMHWSERLAERVIQEKKEPYVITAGMTTSGPVHFGTLCEFLFPSAIKKAIEKKGKECKYYFIADILDAFDSVPLAMEEYRNQLEPHLGKPLCNVPDPTGESRSFGDHYLDEATGLMDKFDVDAEVVRINEYYAAGRFDDYARFFLEHEGEARKIVEKTSGKEQKKGWSPLMPVCQNCGRIATTRVLSHKEDEYEYVCDRDVKYTHGCGYRGKNSIQDHRYKIVWRLHWPAWKQIFNSSIEGAGIDHHTRGGSEDTCRAITLDLMKKEYHIPYRYGFILFRGKKYSKSKGRGMGISEVIKLVPPEIIKYKLFKPDLEENVDINPTSEKMLKTIEDFEGAAGIDSHSDVSRSERKRAIAFSLSTDEMKWESPFLDITLYYQLYGDWEKVREMTGDREGVEYLRPYVEEWVSRNYLPDVYRFSYRPSEPSKHAKEFISGLEGGMEPLDIHNAVFEYAKSNSIPPKQLFAELYQALIGKDRGPKMGKIIHAIGIERLKKDLGI